MPRKFTINKNISVSTKLNHRVTLSIFPCPQITLVYGILFQTVTPQITLRPYLPCRPCVLRVPVPMSPRYNKFPYLSVTLYCKLFSSVPIRPGCFADICTFVSTSINFLIPSVTQQKTFFCPYFTILYIYTSVPT